MALLFILGVPQQHSLYPMQEELQGALLFIPGDPSSHNLQEDQQLEVLNVAHPEVPEVHQNEVLHHHHHLEVLLKIMLHIPLGSQTHHRKKLLGDSLDAP